MGYGVSYYVFVVYVCFDYMMIVQCFLVCVGVVESYLEVDILIDSLCDEGVIGVYLMLLMLVVGDYVINDMVLDDGDLWKMCFNVVGILVMLWLSGLGENLVIWVMFVVYLYQVLNMVVEEVV